MEGEDTDRDVDVDRHVPTSENIVSLIPDHCNKVNITINWVKWMFSFPVNSQVMFTLYSILLCAVILCLKIQCTYLNEKIFYC